MPFKKIKQRAVSNTNLEITAWHDRYRVGYLTISEQHQLQTCCTQYYLTAVETRHTEADVSQWLKEWTHNRETWIITGSSATGWRLATVIYSLQMQTTAQQLLQSPTASKTNFREQLWPRTVLKSLVGHAGARLHNTATELTIPISQSTDGLRCRR